MIKNIVLLIFTTPLKMLFLSAIIPAFLAMTLAGCGDAQTPENLDLIKKNEVLNARAATLASERDVLRIKIAALASERDVLKSKVEEFSITSPTLLESIRSALHANDIEKANLVQSQLDRRFPQSTEANQGHKLIAAQREVAKKAEIEALRLQALGFKAINPNIIVRGPEISAKYGDLTFASRFISDRYDSSYHYRDADRDTKFALINLTATAGKSITAPELPAAGLYWANGASLEKLGDFKIEFARWEDFGTYLGNYPDSRNDFAKTQTITFNLGVQINDEVLKKRPLYVVATKNGCIKRSYEGFRNPPEYYTGTCAMLKQSLNLNDFTESGSDLVVVLRRD